jgi:hypothetical protein
MRLRILLYPMPSRDIRTFGFQVRVDCTPNDFRLRHTQFVCAPLQEIILPLSEPNLLRDDPRHGFLHNRYVMLHCSIFAIRVV